MIRRFAWIRRRASALALAASMTPISPASAQDSAGSFGEYLEVRLVNVELFATDRQGGPVSDLVPEEVRVFEDGEPVEVSHFRAPRDAAATTAASVGRAEPRAGGGRGGATSPGVRIAVFVDNLNSGPSSRSRVLGQLWQRLSSGLSPADEVLVASFDGSLEIQLPFSRDRKQLLQALREVEQLSGDRLFPDLRQRRALERIQTDQDNNRTARRGDPCVHVGNLAREHADEISHDVQRTLVALDDFVGSLAGIPGRKVLIHVSDGVPLIPGAEAWLHAMSLCDGTGAQEGVRNAMNIDVELQGDGRHNRFDPHKARIDMLSYDTTAQWQALAANAAAQRVVFYPFFAAGLVTGPRGDVDSIRTTLRTEIEGVRNDQDTLQILADESGGRTFFNTNDFAPAVAEVVDESRGSYELAYVSPSPGDGRRHAIRVETDRPGVKLRHRKSYAAKSITQRVEDGVLSSLFYGIEENPLAVRVAAGSDGTVVNRRRRVQVRILLPFERLTLLPQGDQRSGLFTVFVAARQASGEMTRVGRREIPVLVAAADLESGAAEAYEYVVEMELGLDRADLAVAVRDELGGETSYVTASYGPPTGCAS